MLKNRLLQLFTDNNERGFTIKAEQDDDEATIFLYDAIGDWYGIEAKSFINELSALEVDTIHIRINSPGGDVFDGRAIRTAIGQLKAKTIAHIDGVCASAATSIALACDEVEMSEGAFFMIHNSWTLVIGNAEDLMQTAELLLKVDDSIVNDYIKKTGMKADELKAMMAAETWFTAQEALENGFVDSVFDGEEVDAKWNFSAYENTPEKLTGKNKLASEENLCYDRASFERRLALVEATL